MNTCVALLRGINVGGRHSLPMKELVSILESMGFEDVRTYIQSGNVVMKSARPCMPETSEAIGAAIEEEFGFRPRVMMLEGERFRAAVADCPFETDVGKTLHLSFLDSVPETPDLEKLESLRTPSESYELRDQVFYLYAPDGIGRSKMAAVVERCLGTPATVRNWNTVQKLVEMLEAT